METDNKTTSIESLLDSFRNYIETRINLLKLNLPQPIPSAWILLILTTPVFFYAGWIFLYSSYYALRARTLNMAQLRRAGDDRDADQHAER